MRATLTEAEKPLAEMKEHINMCMNMMSMKESSQHGDRAASRQQAQTARVAITAKGFEPASIKLKPNAPAKVTFIRQTDQSCATAVAIPEFKIKQDLPLNKPVVVELTPSKTGEFTFACGMNMLKGKIVVQETK